VFFLLPSIASLPPHRYLWSSFELITDHSLCIGAGVAVRVEKMLTFQTFQVLACFGRQFTQGRASALNNQEAIATFLLLLKEKGNDSAGSVDTVSMIKAAPNLDGKKQHQRFLQNVHWQLGCLHYTWKYPKDKSALHARGLYQQSKTPPLPEATCGIHILVFGNKGFTNLSIVWIKAAGEHLIANNPSWL